MLAAADGEQFRADVEADAVVAGAREQRGEGAGAAAAIDDARGRLEAGELDERIGDARARLRGEHVVVVCGGMAVEERDLFLLVLGGCGHHEVASPNPSCPGRSAPKTRVNALMTRASIERKNVKRRGWNCRVKPGNDAFG